MMRVAKKEHYSYLSEEFIKKMTIKDKVQVSMLEDKRDENKKNMTRHLTMAFARESTYYSLKELHSHKTPNYLNYFPVCAVYVLLHGKYPGTKKVSPSDTLEFDVWKIARKVLKDKKLKEKLTKQIDAPVSQYKINMIKSMQSKRWDSRRAIRWKGDCPTKGLYQYIQLTID